MLSKSLNNCIFVCISGFLFYLFALLTCYTTNIFRNLYSLYIFYIRKNPYQFRNMRSRYPFGWCLWAFDFAFFVAFFVFNFLRVRYYCFFLLFVISLDSRIFTITLPVSLFESTVQFIFTIWRYWSKAKAFWLLL